MGPGLTCVKCNAPLLRPNSGTPGIPLNAGMEMPCPVCGIPTFVEAFPALFRQITPGSAGEAIVSTEEAACFYHPQKKAFVPCDSCGRFLCALCDVELEGRHICPNCLQTGRKKGKLRNLENERVLYDRTALTVALLPLLFWPVTIISAPIALYLSIRHWKSPGSLVRRRRRLRFVLAIIFSLLQIGGWAVLLGLWIKRSF